MSIALNTSSIKRFLDTPISETTSLKSNVESIIEQLEGLDKIKEQQTEMATIHSSLIVDTEQKVKSWASLCTHVDTIAPRLSLDKIVQGKIDNEHVRRTHELNLRVRGLPPIADHMLTGHSFFSDQLGISNITLHKCWFGNGDTLFIRFLSFSNRLRALRAKKNCSLSPLKFI